MTALEALISFCLSLAANGLTAAIVRKRQAEFTTALQQEERHHQDLPLIHNFRDEVQVACTTVANAYQHQIGPSLQEKPLWQLLRDQDFQGTLTDWLMAGGIEEGQAARERLMEALQQALAQGGASLAQQEFLRTKYFQALEQTFAAHPVLARWRHQLSLDYLRQEVAELRQLAQRAVGEYPEAEQQAALEHYCKTALDAWDIIDLSNLPEGDMHLATQKLLLRQLYLPLRLVVQRSKGEGEDRNNLARLEHHREWRRLREAGRKEKEPLPYDDSERSSVGERLGVSRRLVVLGDPGSGKTTLLRWLATAYLLRHQGDPALNQLPDTATLPHDNWIPVLIRCRDLGEADLCRSFTEFLIQHLYKTALPPAEAQVMNAVILNRLATGQALLLVDGLDEITNPRVRVQFSQELELTSVRYPLAPIVVTSRIVGYRDMPYRLGSGFEHGVIAELSPKAKEHFAERWVAVTEQHLTADEQVVRTRELVDALYSSDRIERLTGNAMLLTTLALVKRRVGKLPNRRTKLYAEAVAVLLNWRPEIFDMIEEEEAIPQLEYLAYEMCRRGVQRLTEDEIMDLLDRVRAEYPRLRALRRRDPQEFLNLLEVRSSLLIKSGGRWDRHQRKENPVWEFRHLTFQEYLAAKALLDGRYPQRDKTKSLADQVAPLAGSVEVSRRAFGPAIDFEVVESWQEALRLLVADCRDDDVDEVMRALATPLKDEDSAQTARARAVLAARALADEPNVSEETAQYVLEVLASQVDERDGTLRISTGLDEAALKLGQSLWALVLKKCLLREFQSREPTRRRYPGGLWGMVEMYGSPYDKGLLETSFADLPNRLRSLDEMEATAAALLVMVSTSKGKAVPVPGLIPALIDLLSGSPALRQAAAWALVSLSGGVFGLMERKPLWKPMDDDVQVLINTMKKTPLTEKETIGYLIAILGTSSDPSAAAAIIQWIEDDDKEVRRRAVRALGRLGDKVAMAPLVQRLDDKDDDIRQAAGEALGRLGDRAAVTPLVQLLEDENEDVRRAAVEALGRLGDKAAVAPLVQRLNDRNPRVQDAAADALGQLGDKAAVEPLIQRLKEADSGVRRRAVELLGRLGDNAAVAPLIQRLEDHHPRVVEAAVDALGRLGDKAAVIPLINKLEYHDSKVRRKVFDVLGRLGDKAAVIPLIQRLGDIDEEVRLAVISALGALGDNSAVRPLIQRLKDNEEEVRRAVVYALGQLSDKTAVEPLIQQLEDPDARVRRAVVAALAGFEDKAAVAPLVERLEDKDKLVRQLAAEAIGLLGDPEALTPLLQRLGDESWEVRSAAAKSLGWLGDRSAVASLLERLKDEDEDVRRASVEALGLLGDISVIMQLLQCLEDEDKYVRSAVAQAMGSLGDRAAVGPLLQLLEDEDEFVRVAAAQALSQLGEERGVSALREFLRHPNILIRQAAVRESARTRDHVDRLLLLKDLDTMGLWIDPQKTITDARVQAAAAALSLDPAEVSRRYEELAAILGLKLSWLDQEQVPASP